MLSEFAIRTGWKWQENSWYFYTNSGAMKTGWLKDKESWYYLDPETGIMFVGSKEIGSRTISSAQQVLCKLDGSGQMILGITRRAHSKRIWLKDGDTWYYLEGKEGVMLVGSHQVDGKAMCPQIWSHANGWKWFDNHYRYF